MVFLLLIILSTTGEVPAANSRIQILYFFSATCPPCEQSTPVVSELSKDYPVEGIVFGDEVSGHLPFTVRKGTRDDKKLYAAHTVPSLVVLKDGKIRQVLNNGIDIASCRTILKGVERDALTVTEAVLDRSQKTKIVMGWIKSKGEYFKGAQIFLTDRRNAIEVKPWLPLEATKSPVNNKRPRLISDVIDKQVILEGAISKTGGNVIFNVEKEINSD